MINADRQPLRIFVVENDPDTRICFALYLEQLGHTVTVADSVATALAGLRGSQYDMLIADIGLPDGTGWELMERIASDRLPAPRYAIAMSGFGSGADHERSKAAGFREHVVKPVTGAKLEALFADAMRAREG